MEVWGNYNIRDSIKLVVLLKFLAYIFLIWTWYPNRDMYGFGNALENKDEQNKNFYPNFNRLLAKQEIQWELERRKFRDNLSDHSTERRQKYLTEDISSYSQLKKKGLNDFDLYMRNYKDRYAKKKGFSKLDCYCEKKVFDHFQRLYAIGEKLKNEKKSFKNFFLKKYGIGLILFSLIPALGLIYPILFGVKGCTKAIIMFCSTEGHNSAGTHDSCTNYHEYEWEPFLRYIKPIVSIFMFTMIIIISIFVFYALIKVVKYDKLREGKCKMREKGYGRTCKDAFM